MNTTTATDLLAVLGAALREAERLKKAMHAAESQVTELIKKHYSADAAVRRIQEHIAALALEMGP